MATIYTLKYNSYFNRRLKGEDLHSVTDYTETKRQFNNINFVTRDGIHTTQILNIGDTDTFDDNYLLVANGSTILSKWFIIESNWIRLGQRELTLKRDVLCDGYDLYKDMPIYCEKGTMSVHSPFIYNSEGQQFNQVLTSRTPLKQTSSQTGRYIIGYIDKTWEGGNIYYAPELPVYNTPNDVPMYAYTIGERFLVSKLSRNIIFKLSAQSGPSIIPGAHGTAIVSTGGPDPYESHAFYPLGLQVCELGNNNLVVDAENIFNSLTGRFSNFDPEVEAQSTTELYNPYFQQWDGKRFIIGGRVYECNITVPTSGTMREIERFKFSDNVSHAIADVFRECYPGNWASDEPQKSITGAIFGLPCSVSFEAVSDLEAVTIPSTRPGDERLPYNIFCIEDSEAARKFAGYFASQYAGGHVLYDLQLFPFAPLTTDEGAVEISEGVTLKWATSDKRLGTLVHPAIGPYTTRKARKVGANMSMCRLISPDGSSAWEFNPAQIGGITVNSIRYAMTLMPFRPVLKIWPKFGGIYGDVNTASAIAEDEVGENRGLVCGGSFSLPYSSNAWATYKLQNAAYMDSFNRTIQNMSITQHYQHISDVASAVTGTAGAVVGGAITGATVGGPVGAVVGGAVGGIGSAVTGAIDVAINDAMRAEQVSYARDQFNMSLRNIQAQAQPLMASSSVVAGNAYFPILELYEATEDEIAAFEQRIMWNGYTLGEISTVADQKTLATPDMCFMSGKLIRIADVEDGHFAADIAQELYKGVYLL